MRLFLLGMLAMGALIALATVFGVLLRKRRG
jgi:hypothetical protein